MQEVTTSKLGSNVSNNVSMQISGMTGGGVSGNNLSGN
jgi:hypothetical protein